MGFMSVLIGLLVLWLFWSWVRERSASDDQGNYEVRERSHMPAAIATGRLLLSETYHRTQVPRRLGARFDQVFAGSDGLLYLVDTKTRASGRVFDYDQIELSVQAAVLRHGHVSGADGRAVAPTGYVRMVSNGRPPKFIPVRLLSDEELGELTDRYYALLKGRTVPNGPASAGACRKCAYLANCETGQRRLRA